MGRYFYLSILESMSGRKIRFSWIEVCSSLCSPHSVATQDLDLVLPADIEGNSHLVRATSMLVALIRVLSELFFSQESSEYA